MNYTEYSQERVKELMAQSKKEFIDIPDYLMFVLIIIAEKMLKWIYQKMKN